MSEAFIRIENMIGAEETSGSRTEREIRSWGAASPVRRVEVALSPVVCHT
jgi:hypothetical protein